MTRTQRIERSRRDFLAWLGAVPVIGAAGCASASSDSAAAPEGDTEEAWRSCRHTTRDATGPYFEPGSPVRAARRIASPTEPGVRLLVEGRLFGPDCRTPLDGYVLDVWQADANGSYYAAGESEYRLRGKIVTDDLGRYSLETILPGRYGDSEGIRPAHLHVRFLTPGGNLLLTTQLYFAGDPYLGDADYCTRDGTCNSGDAARALVLSDANVSGVFGKYASFNAYLPRS